jgi:hypothetical protein
MDIEIVNTAYQVNLVGKSGRTQGKCYGEKGRELMDAMWSEIRSREIRTTGLNHWVYLPDSQLFTGVELLAPNDDLGSLLSLRVMLDRFVRHVHRGPYSDLPKVWQELSERIKNLDETRVYPNLEIYGHWKNDPSELETTILIGLKGEKSDGRSCQ